MQYTFYCPASTSSPVPFLRPFPVATSTFNPAGASTCPRCHLDLPPLSPRPTPTVISNCPRCHLDRRERSHTAIIRPKKGILGNTRFLASLRNDRGGGISAFALPGNNGILTSLCSLSSRPTSAVVPIHPRLSALSCSVTATSPRLFTLSSTVLTTFPRCHRGLPPLSSRPTPLSSRPQGEISRSKHPQQETTAVNTTGDFSLRFEMTESIKCQLLCPVDDNYLGRFSFTNLLIGFSGTNRL